MFNFNLFCSLRLTDCTSDINQFLMTAQNSSKINNSYHNCTRLFQNYQWRTTGFSCKKLYLHVSLHTKLKTSNYFVYRLLYSLCQSLARKQVRNFDVHVHNQLVGDVEDRPSLHIQLSHYFTRSSQNYLFCSQGLAHPNILLSNSAQNYTICLFITILLWTV